MTTKTIKLIAFLTLLVHGIGHLQGVVSSLGVQFTGATSNTSWLLKSFGDKSNRMICLVLYLLAGLAGIVTALSFFNVAFTGLNWQMTAVITGIFSTLCLVLFPKALAMFFNKAGAVMVNVLIYYSILFQGHWPSVIFED